MMKRYRLLAPAVVLLLALVMGSCSDNYGDSLRDMGARMVALEERAVETNRDIELLYHLARIIERNGYIVDIRHQSGDSYLLIFSDNTTVRLTQGVDGKPGKDGVDGTNTNLLFGLGLGDDGLFYWKLNGEWLLDENGNMIRANGSDGKDGVDGKDDDGSSVQIPRVRINPDTGMWEISTNNGFFWFSTGVYANGKDGHDGKDGEDGHDGKDGEDGHDGKDGISDIFQGFVISDDGTSVTFYFADGQSFTIPIVSSHTNPDTTGGEDNPSGGEDNPSGGEDNPSGGEDTGEDAA